MITHDVDEAIYLADRIVLMTNGPKAQIAEIVENPLPKDRARPGLHHLPHHTDLRNHLIDFLVDRSRTSTQEKTPPKSRLTPTNPTLPSWPGSSGPSTPSCSHPPQASLDAKNPQTRSAIAADAGL